MHKRAPKFEWQSSDDREDPQYVPWSPAVDTTSSVPVVPQRWRTIDGAIAALLLLAMAGGWLWYTAQVGRDQTAEKPRAALQTELTSVDSVSVPTATTGSSGITARAWENQLQRDQQTLRGVLPTGILEVTKERTLRISNLQGGSAVIEFSAATKDGSQVYRQTRFYLYSGSGWLRTRPVAELWGTPRRLESSHFIFLFRQNDAQVVAKVAPQMDALYTKIQQNFGLTPNAEKLVIEVTVEHVTGAMFTPQWAYEPLVVSSPAIYLAPVELNDSDILVQSISLPLIDYMGERAMADHAIPTRWRPLLRGLRLWQLWNLDMPLAQWRQELVKWLYVDAPKATVEQTSMLPPHYSELCAMHRLWMLSPMVVGVPLECAAWVDLARSPSRWGSYVPRTRLDQLSMPLAGWERPFNNDAYDPYYLTEPVVVASLLEYAVEVYGDEQLPVLLADLSHYDTWDTLIPAVYGVSAADFEEGWRAYLVQEYGYNHR